MSQREARHARMLEGEGVALFVISALVFMSTEPAFSDMITMGFADDMVELWQHASMVVMTAAAARISAALKITWLDPKLWLCYHRDPECTCDFEHCVSGRGWGTAWSSLRDGATDLA